MHRMMSLLISVPKTLIANIKVFGIRKGIMMPIFVSYRVKLKGLKRDSWIIDENTKFASIRLGVTDGSFGHGRGCKSSLIMSPESRIYFGRGINIANNFSINLGRNATIVLGESFNSNFNLILSCSTKITFGKECLLGWNCTFIDSDGHEIWSQESVEKNNPKNEIHIGDHVWVASNATCLKGTNICDNSVIGTMSVVSNRFEEDGVIVAGVPAHIVKRNIYWKR